MMVLTLELPIRPAIPDDISRYESRFGALPPWLDELPPREVRALARLALRRGAPLTVADSLFA